MRGAGRACWSWVVAATTAVGAAGALAWPASGRAAPAPARDGHDGRCVVTLRIALGGDAWAGASQLEAAALAMTWAGGESALVDAAALGYQTRVHFEDTDLVVSLEGPAVTWREALRIQRARVAEELDVGRWRGARPALEAPLAPAVRGAGFVRAVMRAWYLPFAVNPEAAAARLTRALEEGPVALTVDCGGSRGSHTALPPELAARAKATPTPLPPRDRSGGERQLPMTRAGFGRLWLVWELPRVPGGAGGAPDPWAPLVARLLAHPGERLTERAIGAYGIARAIDAAVLPSLDAFVLVVDAAGRDPRAAQGRILEDLAAFAVTPAEIAGAARLAGMAADGLPTAVELGRWVRTTLTASRVTSVVEPTSAADRTPFPVIDSDLVGRWFRATLDLRCPAAAETRDRTQLLAEKHALDSERYLALTRAIGSDPERLSQLEREISDRCLELKKLRGLVAPRRLVALYRAIRCAPPAANEAAGARAEGRVFRQFDVDPSAFRPLVTMAQEDPQLLAALAEIDRRCPARAPAKPSGGP